MEDYRALLLIYMYHVGEIEGTCFLGRKPSWMAQEVYDSLCKLSDELDGVQNVQDN